MSQNDQPGSRWAEIASRLQHQTMMLRPLLLAIYLPVVLLFAIAIVVRLQTGIAVAEFTRDPLGYTEIPVYTGSISNLGVMIWTSTVAICLFSYGVTRGRARGSQTSRFLLGAGLVTLLLALDDLFMLHEVVFPENVGIPENLVYATYFLLVAGLLIHLRMVILQTPFLLLALAGAGFGLSILADFLAPMVTIPGLYIFEDGGKLVGIVSWAAYFTLVSVRHIGRWQGETALAS